MVVPIQIVPEIQPDQQNSTNSVSDTYPSMNRSTHRLRTPNEGINQRNLKLWKWETKYALAVPKILGLGLNFRPRSESYFFSAL